MILKVGICIYIIIAMFHLIMSFKEAEKYRKISKPLLMITLVAMILIFSLEHKVDKTIVIIGAICGLLGDILLIYQYKITMFIAGAIFFFIGHVFYILQTLIKIPDRLSTLAIAIILIALFVWSIIVCPIIKDKLKKLTVACNLYGFILFLALGLSIYGYIVLHDKNFFFVIFGYVLFIISDSILLYASFYKKFRRHHFYLMAPYIAAQALIIIGLLKL